MNLIEAQKAIKSPLIFGNEHQIQAIRFLDAVQEIVEAIKESPECENCQGNGQVEEPCDFCAFGDECDECDGKGAVVNECSDCGGLGYFVTDWPSHKEEILNAARTFIMDDRKRCP